MITDAPSSTVPLRVRSLQLSEANEPDRELNFDVLAGEIVVILGGNGSGKSLLLSCMAGQRISPDGEIDVFGSDLFQRKSRPRALEYMGIVFQHPGLLRTLSVFDNVALPFLEDSLSLTAHLAELVRLRLDLFGCGHLSELEPEVLSEGDRRCVALARALSGSTRILMADEPVAALSFEKRTRVEELLSGLVRRGALDCAVLFSQDVEFAIHVGTRFLFLRDPDPKTGELGGIREERTIETLLAEPLPPEVALFQARRAERRQN